MSSFSDMQNITKRFFSDAMSKMSILSQHRGLVLSKFMNVKRLLRIHPGPFPVQRADSGDRFYDVHAIAELLVALRWRCSSRRCLVQSNISKDRRVHTEQQRYCALLTTPAGLSFRLGPGKLAKNCCEKVSSVEIVLPTTANASETCFIWAQPRRIPSCGLTPILSRLCISRY